MRPTLLLVLVLAGCGEDPVLAGRLAPREYGGLMFFQGPSRLEPLQLHYQHELGGVARPVEPAHFGGGSPVVSRDGEWFAWVDDAGRIRVRQLRNRSGIILTSSADWSYAPRWSPEGRYLVFVRRRDQQSGFFSNERELVILDRTTGRERVLKLDATNIFSPDWAPTGGVLVWHRVDPHRIELATLEGGVIRVLATAGGEVLGVGVPQFSPDGRYVAYVADRAYEDGGDEVTVVDLEGRVISRTTLAGGSVSYTWAPDGGALAFCILPQVGEFEYGPERVEVIDLATGTLTTVSGSDVVACNPMWGPR